MSINVRDRVKAFRRVKASELRKNGKNFRAHPATQQDAFRGLLEEVGIVGALIARETPDGLELLDGHMRQDVLEDAEVPVLIVDLNDDEAEKVLLTYDPIGSMAKSEDSKLKRLLESVTTESADLRRLLADVERGAGLGKKEKEATPDVTEEESTREIPGMGLEPHEHYDYVVVLCSTTQEWNVLCDMLDLAPERDRRGKLGVSRAIRAAKVLEAFARLARPEEAKPA